MENGIVRMLWGGALHFTDIVIQRGPGVDVHLSAAKITRKVGGCKLHFRVGHHENIYTEWKTEL